MSLQPSTRLGPYEIISSIGAGGMGEVYRARDTRLDRIVAVKVLPEHLSSNPQLRERFDREAKAISSLSHPHICPLYDVGHQDGIDYLVMEHLEGETLAQRLKKGPLPPERALEYAIQIADALDTAHRHGVIHRDLKPGNIMLVKTGAKLLDFGLAKVRAAEAVAGMTAMPTQTTPLTGEGTILGTLQYMAPEQLEGAEADARTDIFSLGALIYEMATGHKAFEGRSQASLISAIMSSEPPALSTVQAMTPVALDQVVKTCLAKDPDARWQAAHDVLVQLKWIAGAGATAELAAPAAARFRKRAWVGWIVATCLLAALIAALAITYLHPAPEARVVQFDVPLPALALTDTPNISPDGQYVAIPGSEAGQPRLWLHSLNSGDTSALPGTEGVDAYFWSPDSRQIGFSTSSGLKKINLARGVPQTIYNGTVFGSGAWNRDGTILFCPGQNQPLYKVSAMGGEPRAVTKLDQSRQENVHFGPQFLPDGRHFIYAAWSTKPENTAIYLGSLDSPQVKHIHDGYIDFSYAPPGHLIFTIGTNLMAQRFDVRKGELSGEPILLADSLLSLSGPYGTLGFFSLSDNGVLTYLAGSDLTLTQLLWFDRTGKRLGIAGDPADYSNPAISPDQKKIAVGKRDPRTKTRDIWVIDLLRNASSRFTFDPRDDLNPSWSPDGTRIIFTSNRKGHRDIYVKPANGAGEEQMLLQSDGNKNVEDWSSDGQYLLWGSDTEEWLFSFKEHKSLPLPKFTQEQGRFCPSGTGPPRWFAYTSHETGARQVYVRSFAGALTGSGARWQISTNGGTDPSWRGDGKELFYLSGNKLMAVEVNGDGESFQSGNPKELFETPVSVYVRNRYIASADAKRFLVNVPLREKEGIRFKVVLNWPTLLTR